MDLLHGHSSHHPRPVELHRDKLALYGCGDFISDYEGITGYPHLDSATGELVDLHMTPLRIRKMQLIRPSARDPEIVIGCASDLRTSRGTLDVT